MNLRKLPRTQVKSDGDAFHNGNSRCRRSDKMSPLHKQKQRAAFLSDASGVRIGRRTPE